MLELTGHHQEAETTLARFRQRHPEAKPAAEDVRQFHAPAYAVPRRGILASVQHLVADAVPAN